MTRGSCLARHGRVLLSRSGPAREQAGHELDGLTVSHWDGHPQWWFNLRASNTEPLLRLNVEAADEDIMEKVRDDVLGLVRQDGEV